MAEGTERFWNPNTKRWETRKTNDGKPAMAPEGGKFESAGGRATIEGEPKSSDFPDTFAGKADYNRKRKEWLAKKEAAAPPKKTSGLMNFMGDEDDKPMGAMPRKGAAFKAMSRLA